MTDSTILGIPLVSPNQNNKETTMNDAISILERSLNSSLIVALGAANATLTADDFRRNWVFVCSGHTVARTLIIPNQVRYFAVKNEGTGIVTVQTAAPVTTASCPAGSLLICFSTGDNKITKIADSAAALSVPLFTNLTDAPSSYVGHSKKRVRVNTAETGLEFDTLTLTDLTDVQTPIVNYFPRWNAAGTAIEWVPSTGTLAAEFLALNDTPANYTGSGGKLVRVNAGATALEFVAKDAALSLKDMTDVPDSIAAQSGKILAVNVAENGFEFVDLPSLGVKVSRSSGSANAGFENGDLSGYSITIGSTASNSITTNEGGLPAYTGTFMYHAGGAGVTQTEIQRLYDLTSWNTATELDGNARLDLPVAFAKLSADTTGIVTVQAQTAAGGNLGTTSVTNFTGTINNWAFTNIQIGLPIGTRRLLVSVRTNSPTAVVAAWDALDPTITVTQPAAFTKLTDVPQNYTGAAKKVLRVKSTVDGVEFVALKSTDLADVPTSLVSHALQVLRVNAGETALEYYTPTFTMNSIDDIIDVIINGATLAANQVLTWDGTKWVNAALPAQGITTLGTHSIDELNDVTITSPTTDDALRWNGTQWVNSNLNRLTIVTDATITRSLAVTDAFPKYLRFTSANPVTVNVNASIFSAGDQIHLRQAGLGQITVAPGTGVTVNTPETYKTRKLGASAVLVCITPTTFDLTGDLELTP